MPNRAAPLNTIRDLIGSVVKQVETAVLNLDFRTPYYANHGPEHLLNLHPADFLFVDARTIKNGVLHVQSNGNSEWIDNRCAATGNGDQFAHALLQKYAQKTLAIEKTKILAHKVIEEVIRVGAWGLGPPVVLWEVATSGAKEITQSELAEIGQNAESLRALEIGLLVDGPTSSVVPPRTQADQQQPPLEMKSTIAAENIPAPESSLN